MTRAGFFARFVAFLVDNIALTVLAWVLGALVAPLFAGVAATGIPVLSWVAAGFSILTLLILPFFQFFYFGWMWSRPSGQSYGCLLYTSPSPRDRTRSRMPSSA